MREQCIGKEARVDGLDAAGNLGFHSSGTRDEVDRASAQQVAGGPAVPRLFGFRGMLHDESSERDKVGHGVFHCAFFKIGLDVTAVVVGARSALWSGDWAVYSNCYWKEPLY